MDIDFYKIVSGQNDLILINFLKIDFPNLELLLPLTRSLCNRRSGVGGNGVLILLPSEKETLKLRYFRPDGQESVLLNDALLCLARYIFDSGMASTVMTVETIRGIRRVELLDSRNFRLNLGSPLAYNLNPLKPDPDIDFSELIRLQDRNLSMVPLFLGKKGAAFLDGGQYRGRRKEIIKNLKNLSNKEDSPHPIFVTIRERDEIGVDSPLDRLNSDNVSSCALGGSAAVLSGLTENELLIRSRRSRYYYEWDSDTNSVFITGSADYAFSGSFYFDEGMD
ncbi:MAG: hypothetical protein JEY99_10345 [Spirochaetales bacterium]|nr:hypothetical protein [Spirochaetales bacterium]